MRSAIGYPLESLWLHYMGIIQSINRFRTTQRADLDPALTRPIQVEIREAQQVIAPEISRILSNLSIFFALFFL